MSEHPDERPPLTIKLPFGRGAQFRVGGNRPLPGWAADIDCNSWTQVFLKYVLSQPAVTCAIPGSTQVAHVEDNRYFDAIVDG